MNNCKNPRRMYRKYLPIIIILQTKYTSCDTIPLTGSELPYDGLLLLFELLLGLAPVRLLVLLEQTLCFGNLCCLQDKTFVGPRKSAKIVKGKMRQTSGKNQCCGSGSGNRFIPDPGSRIPNLYFWKLSDTFLSKKFYNSLKFGPNFFLQHFKNKFFLHFVKFVATKKFMTTNFFHPSFCSCFGSVIRDPGWVKIRIRYTGKKAPNLSMYKKISDWYLRFCFFCCLQDKTFAGNVVGIQNDFISFS